MGWRGSTSGTCIIALCLGWNTKYSGASITSARANDVRTSNCVLEGRIHRAPALPHGSKQRIDPLCPNTVSKDRYVQL